MGDAGHASGPLHSCFFSFLHAFPAKRQSTSCRQGACKGCQIPTPCWTRQIQARPNQPWARCSVFLPPPASRGHSCFIYRDQCFFVTGLCGCMQGTLVGLLAAFSYELSILHAAARLTHADAFRTLHALYRERTHPLPAPTAVPSTSADGALGCNLQHWTSWM